MARLPPCRPGPSPCLPPNPPVQGDLAAVTPVYTYAIPGQDGAMPEGSAFAAWRQLLGWLGPPGLVLAVLCLLTVDEPRTAAQGGFLGDPLKSSRFLAAAESTGKSGGTQSKRTRQPTPAPAPAQQRPWSGVAAAGAGAGAVAAAAAPPGGDTAGSIADSLSKLRVLLASPKFQAITFASAINDVGSWALVSWQATFYQRVYELPPETYAPLLAVVIPIGGIIGGVGAGGWMGGRARAHGCWGVVARERVPNSLGAVESGMGGVQRCRWCPCEEVACGGCCCSSPTRAVRLAGGITCG